MRCDNIATVQVINSGRSDNTFMQACARELIFLACKWEFEVVAVHIMGVENTLPDWLSRSGLDNKYSKMFIQAMGGQFTQLNVPNDIWEFSSDW